MNHRKPKFTNRPPHLKIDDSFYFITARTVEGQWFLRPEKYRQILLEKIQEKVEKFSFSLVAFVILPNHYHLMVQVGNPTGIKTQAEAYTPQSRSPRFSVISQAKACSTRVLGDHPSGCNSKGLSKDIPKFMAELNGASSFAINQADDVTGRKIWWNYFDHIIRDEADFFKHLNYLHQNPIKHGVNKDFDYQFSSYKIWQKQKGQEYLDDCLAKYPIVDFVTQNDEY